jgi:hypothetical protein
VKNFLKVTQGGASLEIPTGNEVGVGIQISQNPVSGVRSVFVALGKELHRYSLPDGQLTGKITCDDNLNCLNVNTMVCNKRRGSEITRSYLPYLMYTLKNQPVCIITIVPCGTPWHPNKISTSIRFL